MTSSCAEKENTTKSVDESQQHMMLCEKFGSSPKRHPVLQEFERKLAEKLDALKEVGEELGFLSDVDWLSEALSVVVSTHVNMKALIPNLRDDEKWVREYLDDSAKLLEVCNVLTKGIAYVEGYPLLVQLAIRNLQGEDRCYHSARNVLSCMGESEWRAREAELLSCSSMLRTMGKKLVINPKGNGFLSVAIYGYKLTTIFLCSLVVIALAGKPRRPLDVNLPASSQCLWASSLLNLQQRVKEETDNKTKGLLGELYTVVDVLVRRLHGIVDKKLNAKSALVLNASEAEELRSVVASLSLGRGLDSLRECVNELFQFLTTI